ncbi:MAG: ABC transporter ATP-binding protein [Oligoflexia bacterium]|nr:ABC transporter ATP-binding protein [Oligoflexia bacterium]
MKLVSMKNISKSFFGNYANKDVDFDLFSGEIHALLGENGAGKSTLMNILAGLYRADVGVGEILINGRPVILNSPTDALAAGVGMVHQHFSLVKNFTVAQNILLGTSSLENVFFKRNSEQIVEEFSNKCKISVNPGRFVWQLSVGEQEKVEILKLLYRNTKILILDEPTAVLTPQEIEELFITLKNLVKKDGVGVVLITHKMKEVMQIADRISVMRNGKMIKTLKRLEVADETTLAQLMMGQERASSTSPARPVIPSSFVSETAAIILEIKNITVKNDRNIVAVKDLNLTLQRGEILGIAGIAGNGQVELLEAIAGIRKVETFEKIVLDQKEISFLSIKERIKLGLRYIPADRHRDSIVGSLTVHDSVILKDYHTQSISKGPFLLHDQIKKITKQIFDEFKVVGPGENVSLGLYSGGNQQKVVMGRELRVNPQVILAHSPTRGLDLMTTSFIHQLFNEKRSQGVGVIVVSEDIDELIDISDRIVVISQGKITGILNKDEYDRVKIGLLMTSCHLEPPVI